MKETLEKLADKKEQCNGKILYSFNEGVHVTCPSEEPICDRFKDIILDGDKIILFNRKCYGRIIHKSKWHLTTITKIK